MIKKVVWAKNRQRAIVNTGHKTFDRTIVAPFRGNCYDPGYIASHVRAWNDTAGWSAQHYKWMDNVHEPGDMAKFDLDKFLPECPRMYIDWTVKRWMGQHPDAAIFLCFFKTYNKHGVTPQGAFFVDETNGEAHGVYSFNRIYGRQILRGMLPYFADMALEVNLYTALCFNINLDELQEVKVCQE